MEREERAKGVREREHGDVVGVSVVLPHSCLDVLVGEVWPPSKHTTVLMEAGGRERERERDLVSWGVCVCVCVCVCVSAPPLNQ